MSQSAYLVLLKPWGALTANDELWLRLPSVVVAALAAALLVVLGTRLFDRTTGIVAGVFLATNELVLQWSQEVRTYALVTFAVVLATLLFVRALDDPSRLNWLLYALVAAFAVYCHFWAGFVIATHAVSLPFAPQRPSRRRVVEAAIVFVVLIGPALYFTMRAGREQLEWIPETSWDNMYYVLRRTTGQNWLAAALAAGGVIVLAYRARTRARLDEWRLVLVAGWIFIPVVLGIVVSEVRQPIVVDHYVIVITPGIALAGALVVTLVARRQRSVAVVALVAVLVVSGYRAVQWYRSVPEDWRAAAAYVHRARTPGDTVVIAPDWAVSAYTYYDPETPVTTSPPAGRAFVVIRVGREGNLQEIRDAAIGTAPRPLLEERHFGKGVTVQLLGPPSS